MAGIVIYEGRYGMMNSRRDRMLSAYPNRERADLPRLTVQCCCCLRDVPVAEVTASTADRQPLCEGCGMAFDFWRTVPARLEVARG